MKNKIDIINGGNGMKIAIIGMGVAGVSVLKEMTRYPAFQNQEIVLYDSSQTIGTGLPYQPDTDVLLLNQPADTMSMDQDKKLGFAEWIEKKKGYKDAAKIHFPRPWYGEYLRDVMQDAIDKLDATVILEKVTDLDVMPDGKILVHSSSSTEEYDLVHFCVGHMAYQDPYDLLGHPHYIHNPYPAEKKLKRIPDGSRVGIIGTGLTGLDMMRCLKILREDMKIYFVSDTGTFTTTRVHEPVLDLQYVNRENLEQEKQQNNGFVSLDTMLEWFRKECESLDIDLEETIRKFGSGTREQLKKQMEDEEKLGVLQAIIHQMDYYLPDYWLALNELDKKRYKKEYMRTFELIRTSIPQETVNNLLTWWDTDQVSVFENMESVTESPTEFEIGFAGGGKLSVDYLINATGQDKQIKISKYNSALLNNSLNKRILQPEPFDGVQVTWPDSCAISQRYGVIDNLFVHGQVIEGLQYGNNSAGMLLRHAAEVVKKIAEKNV